MTVVSAVDVEREARMGLAVLMLGESKLLAEVAADGPVAVWERLRSAGDGSVWARRAQLVDVDELAAATTSAGARFIIPSDEEWPTALADLDETEGSWAPVGLWVKGINLREMGQCVTIVGARACTTYGEHAAVTLAADLALEGITIVSGMAYGVDAAAHRGALGVGGTTIAVVASGIDRPYPSANAALARRITETGALVSELPPGAEANRAAFASRNRIMAALATTTVVVESAARSGAVMTANWSTRLGRATGAMPGPITSSLSEVPHRMIREGQAQLVTAAADIPR